MTGLSTITQKILSNQRQYYHYSVNELDVIKSKNSQEGRPLKSIPKYENYTDPDYKDSISLFIDPVPLDIIGKLYKDHPIWYSGNVIYEHCIIPSGIPNDLFFRIMETQSRDKFYDEYIKHNPGELGQKYLEALWLNSLSIGESGYGKLKLLIATKHLLGVTRKAYIESGKHNHNTVQYAPDVPHVLIYPKGGTLKINSITKMIIA